jgi:DNA-binding GntR family transcriptional regulator
MDWVDVDSTDEQAVYQPLAESVYKLIKDRVMNLRIPPNTHINIDQLARDLGVSNTPVREALTRLCSEGLVQRKSRFGFRSSSLLTELELRELFFMRGLLEGAAAELAWFGESRAELIRTLKASLTEMKGIQEHTDWESDSAQYRTFSDADAKFHTAVAGAAQNQLLADTLKSFNSHAHSYRLYFHLGMSAETLVEHKGIVDAFVDGEASMAVAAMRHHLDRSLSRLLRAYDGPSGETPRGLVASMAHGKDRGDVR